MTVSIQFTQPTPGAAPAGESVRNGVVSETVTVTTNELATLTIEAVPLGAPLPALSVVTTNLIHTFPTSTFYGKYRLKAVSLVDGSIQIRTFGLPTPVAGLLAPSWNEVGDPAGSEQNQGAAVIAASDDNAPDADFPGGNPTAWTRDIQALVNVVESLSSVGSSPVVISPAAITTKQDDYTMDGLLTQAVTHAYLTCTTASIITGFSMDAAPLASIANGHAFKVTNDGPSPLALIPDDTDSVAANRFYLPGTSPPTLLFLEGDTLEFIRDDNTPSGVRWRVI